MVAGLAMAGLSAGCSSDAQPAGSASGAPESPFAPATLRVHPLTHVDEGPELPGGGRTDRCTVVLHFELKDRYADSVKGLGTLKVELYKPGTGATPGIETQELVWDVPQLADPDENTKRFDQATRTYRIPLIAPRWVADWLNAAAPQPDWLKLRAVLTTTERTGVRYLDDEYVLQK